MNKPCLLIIEDDDLQYEIYEDALADYQLTRVRTGTEALAGLAELQPDLILLDHILDEGELGLDYLPELKVTGLPTLQRGENSVSADGTVHRARLERRSKDVKKLDQWDWFDNPFFGTQEFNGLRVMMSLLNDWDLSTLNNSIYAVGTERRYVVSDVGATFGNTGNSFTRSKSAPKDYADSTFIEKTTPDFIDFALHSRPFFLSAINVSNYRDRTRMEQVTKHIPRADAKWLGRRLSMLSEEQIRDGFRAAGYTHEEIEIFTQAMRKRIAALGAL